MVDKKIDTVPKELFPVRSSDGRILFEYALQIKIKMLRKEYADFIRAITPLIADLMEDILKNQCHVNVKDYTFINKKRDKTTGKITGVREWDRKTLVNTEILDILQESYGKNNSSFNYGPVFSDALVNLIMYKSSDTVLKKRIEEIQSVEKNIRNLAAHEIVSIDNNLIMARTGFQISNIMKKIQALFGYTNIRPSNEDWNAYDHMNEYIISRI